MILKGETGVSDETVMQLLLHKVAAVWKDQLVSLVSQLARPKKARTRTH